MFDKKLIVINATYLTQHALFGSKDVELNKQYGVMDVAKGETTKGHSFGFVARNEESILTLINGIDGITFKKVIVNLIGSGWVGDFDRAGIISRIADGLVGTDFVINLVDDNTRQVTFQDETIVATFNASHSLPKNAPERFKLYYMFNENRLLNSLVLKAGDPPKLITSGSSAILKRTSSILVIDDGKDLERTKFIQRLKSLFKKVSVRTMKAEGELSFLGLSSEIDQFVRHMHKSAFTYRDTYDHDGCPMLETLMGLGYVEHIDGVVVKDVDPEDSDLFNDIDVPEYRLTQKGLVYKEQNTARPPVSEGVAEGDVVIDASTGLWYQVMSIDLLSGGFNLMCQDYSSKVIDITDAPNFFTGSSADRADFEKICP